MDTPMASTPQGSAVCTCGADAKRSHRLAKWATAGGFLAALGICSACCLLPFALVVGGVATAWAGTLEALAPYKWIFIALAASLLGYGFYVAYRKPRSTCSAGIACSSNASSRRLKVGLWAVTTLAIAGIAFEQIEPYLDLD